MLAEITLRRECKFDSGNSKYFDFHSPHPKSGFLLILTPESELDILNIELKAAPHFAHALALQLPP
jgi:hypothetical protein